MKVSHAAQSDVGLTRQGNEDAYLINQGLGLYVVADGMGGAAAGEIASRTLCEELDRYLRKESDRLKVFSSGASNMASSTICQLLAEGIRQAGLTIHRMAEANQELAGMGTTVVAALALGEHLFIAHVGDSRVYLYRGGELHQLTRDHSLVEELKQLGKIENLDQIKARYRNAVTRAVGVYETVQPDTLDLIPQAGDRYLLCSDGLHNTTTEEELLWLLKHQASEDCTANLIRHANSRGGKDNITAVILDVDEVDSAGAVLNQQKLDTLREITLFRFFSFDELLKVASLFEEQRFQPGAMICREGEMGESLFVLLEGEGEVRKNGGKVASVGAGDHFGELSLVDRHPRSADVMATSPCLCMVMSRKRFYGLVREASQMTVKLLWSLAQVASARLRQTTDELELARSMVTSVQQDSTGPLPYLDETRELEDGEK